MIVDDCQEPYHVETWLDMIVDDCQEPSTSATCMCSLSNTYLCKDYIVLSIIIIIVRRRCHADATIPEVWEKRMETSSLRG